MNKVIYASTNIRRRIIRMSYQSGHTSHLGGSLSLVEILSTLFFGDLKLDIELAKTKNRNRFILSKGHGALALFATLIEAGYMDESMENSYMKNGSELIAHPIKNTELGIESSNGSLGQGLSFAVGIALASKLQKIESTVYCVIGDGECGEGSIWESAMSATDLEINNMVLFIDCNGYQSDGPIRPNLTAEKLLPKWKSFGWEAKIVDGHNVEEIYSAILSKSSDLPLVLICKTIKGKGVSFMENNNTWHHNRLTEELFKEALIKLENIQS